MSAIQLLIKSCKRVVLSSGRTSIKAIGRLTLDGAKISKMHAGSIFLTLVVANAPAIALNTGEMKVFGHTIEVVGPINEQKLLVDGKALVNDAFVLVDQIDVVGGTGVLIGSTSGGGNVCNAAPFVVSLPKGGPAKVDGPLEGCGGWKAKVGESGIEIVYPAFPGQPGKRQSWTLAGGFKDLGPIVFEPDSRLRWDALRRHDIASPIDLYRNRDVGAAIKTLTAADDETFANGLMGPSDGEFSGDTYFGRGCVAHNCSFAGSFVIVDRAAQKVFVAWKPMDKPFVVRPRVKEWPSAFRSRLKEWTQKFD